MYELTIKADFAASHRINGHAGKCKNLHGHTYKVEVVLRAAKLDGLGMVVDFADVKRGLRRILERLDHAHLNDIPPFDDVNPTAENIARHIYEEFSKTLKEASLVKVTVWESDSAGVTYKEAEGA